MNLDRLYQVLRDTTAQLRKGGKIEGDPELVEAVKNLKPGDEVNKLPGGVVHIYVMPHTDQVNGLEKVDCHFLVIGVDKARAEASRAELITLLSDYPEPERLAGGPSYIEMGAVIGDQGAAFQLFALGKVLGLWDVITPEKLGLTGQEADDLAGCGFVMISGFRAA